MANSLSDLLKKKNVPQVPAVVESTPKKSAFASLRKATGAATKPPEQPQPKPKLQLQIQATFLPDGLPPPVAISETEFQFPDQPDAFTQEQVDQLSGSLRTLINAIDRKEMVGDAIKIILHQLKNHPFLADMLKPVHCNMLVRGLRESYGTTLNIKTTKQAKKKKGEAEIDAIIAGLTGAQGGGSFKL